MKTKLKEPTQRELQEFVDREIYYCASSLVSELIKDEKYMDALLTVSVQDDWESAYLESRERADLNPADPDFSLSSESEQRDFFEKNQIEPYQREAYEHWIVSNWLAAKLEEHGEMILRDFLGLTI